MNNLVLLGLAALVATAASVARAAPLTPELMVRVKEVSDPAISPDGRTIAFELKSLGDGASDTDIWLVDASGRTQARLFRGGPTEQSNPTWSPDGRMIAFVEDGQLYVTGRDGKQPRRLTRLGGKFSDFAWLPDGKRIAYAAGGLHLVELDGGATRELARGVRNIDDISPSPDGSELAINADGKLHIVTTATGELARTLSTNISERWSRRHIFDWSPDGKRILFAELESTERSPAGIGFWMATVGAGGGASKPLLKDYRGTITKALWAPDSRHIIAQSYEGTASKIIEIDPDSGKVRTLVRDILAEKSFDLSGDRRALTFVGATPTSPPTVWSWTQRAGARALADFNPQLRGLDLGEVRELSWKNRDRVIHGVLVLPVGYRQGTRYPMVVQLHGGPHYAWWRGWYGNWHDWAQLLAGRGFAVLLPNPRGSTGQGIAFSLGNVNDTGCGPLSDVMAGVDHLIASGIADPNRLGVGGWSYGGYLTAWTITQTDRFKAAVVGAGIVRAGTDQAVSLSEYYGNLPADDREKALNDNSPITHVHKVATPTLVIHGAKDSKISHSQAEELHQALKQRSITTELVVYPGEGHSIGDAGNVRDMLSRIAGWYERHLK